MIKQIFAIALFLVFVSLPFAYGQGTALSGLSPGAAISGSDLFYDVQTQGTGGVKVTGTQFLAFIFGNVSGNCSATGAGVFTCGGTLGPVTVTVRSSAAATVTASTTDYFLCLDPTSNAITVNLPASPSTGRTFLIKDCTGQAATHNITITPASGNIDGSATLALLTAFQSVAVTYTGTQWSAN